MRRPRTAVEQGEQPDGVQSVMIVLGVIEYLAARECAGVTEIAAALGATKARVHRHLRTLVTAGYASQDEGSEQYSIGSRLVALAHLASLDSALIRIAKPTMMRVRDRLGHTVLLDKINAKSAEIIDSCPGAGLVEVAVKRHQSLPLHASVAGKLALAFADDHAKAPMAKRPLAALTPETITDPEVLALELEKVRQRGWAAAPEQFALGINCLGAPIFNQRGQIVGSIALLDSVQFLTRTPTKVQISTIMDAAKEISAILALKRPG